VRLDSPLQNNQGHFLSAQPSHCFTILLCLGSQRLKTLTLLDFGASACFLDEEFTRLHKIPIVKRLNPVHIEVIDKRLLSFGNITYKTIHLEVNFGNHSSSIVFNIIRTPSVPVILGLSWLERYNLQINWKSRNIEFLVTPSLTEHTSKPSSIKKPLFIKPLFIGARAFMKAAKTGTPFAIYATPTSEETTTSTNISTEYKEFQAVFEKKNVDILSEHQPYDCAIDLQDGAQPLFGPIYNLSQNELSALKGYIKENLAKNFIRHSKSSTSVPIFFVKKNDRSLRMCVDYCGLNKITMKNRYSLQLIFGLLNQLGQAKIYTKIDLQRAYNLVRIKEGDERKTAFRTRYGHLNTTSCLLDLPMPKPSSNI
jgi:hypothetical protein